jgi:hypothetical protein
MYDRPMKQVAHLLHRPDGRVRQSLSGAQASRPAEHTHPEIKGLWKVEDWLVQRPVVSSGDHVSLCSMNDHYVRPNNDRVLIVPLGNITDTSAAAG